MRKSIGMVLLVMSIAVPLAVFAEDSFRDVEYISGLEAQKKKKGILQVGEKELRFTDKKGRPIFTVPLEDVTEATGNTEQEDKSFGKKFLTGQGTKSVDYVYVTVETEENAFVLVFKCKNQMAMGIAAKINFQLKRLKEASTG